MSLWKRGERYWCDFTVNGTRYRLPLETTDQREAKRREKDKISEAQGGKLAPSNLNFARLGFEAAADRWLAEIAVQRPQSVRNHDPRQSWEGDLVARLRPFFSGRRLNQINADMVRSYQADRLAQGKNPNTVNHEVRALLRLLKRAKLYTRLRDDIKLLPEKKTPRVMLPWAQKQTLFETAALKPEWHIAYCAALLTANTTLRPCEIKRAKWTDLEAVERLIFVPRSKTEAGTREIPLNDEAWAAIVAMKQQADALGLYQPDHYIFPRQHPVDPTRPMGSTGWRSAWRSLTRAVKCPKCGTLQQPRDTWQKKDCKTDMRGIKSPFRTLRFYDSRHQCVTELLENGVPEGTVRELAGHIDPEMTRRYSHPRRAARRAAVASLSVVNAAEQMLGQSLPKGFVSSQVVENKLISFNPAT